MEKKYKINDCLDSMPYLQYMKAANELPKMLGISRNTFHNYRKILVNVKKDIPYRIVCMMEIYFNIPFGTLRNYEISLNPSENNEPNEANSLDA